MSEQPKEKLGVDEIKKVLDVVIEGGNVAEDYAKADTVVKKVMALVPMTDELLRLISLSPVALKAQWKDLDDQEREELKEHAKAKYDLDDKNFEALVEEGLDLIDEYLTLINKTMDYSKKFKKEGDKS